MATNADTRIKTILTADSGDLEAGMKRATKAVESAAGKFEVVNKRAKNSFTTLGKAVKGLAVAFIVNEVINYGKAAIHAADQLQTLSERTGVSAQFFSALQPEIENAGGSLEDFAGALNKMNINLADALSGNRAAIAKFAAIGVAVEDLRKLNPEQQFLAIATALSKLGTTGQQAKGGVDIFGKGVVSILPTLVKGGDALAAFVAEQERLGLAMSNDTVARLDDLGDSINTLSIQSKNFSGLVLVSSLDGIRKSAILLKEVYVDLYAAAARLFGLDISDIANDVLLDYGQKIDDINTPKTPKGKGSGGNNLLDADSITKAQDKAKANAERLIDELQKLQDQTNRDVYTSGLTALDEKLKKVDFTVADLAKRFKTELTPAQLEQVEAIKDNIKVLDGLEKKQKDSEKLAADLGGAFSDAFEDGVMGAEKFGDVLSSLGKQIEKIFFNQLVTQPINDFFGNIAKGASSGEGNIFSKLFGMLPSYAIGTDNVPHNMTANIHKGEMIIPAREASAIRNGGGGGGTQVNVSVINNTPSQVKTSTQQSSNGTELIVMVDQAVAANIARRDSATSQALSTRDSRSLTRR